MITIENNIQHIKLPIPPTLNKKFISRNFIVSTEYRDYKDKVPFLLKKAKTIKKGKLRNVVIGSLIYYCKDERRDIDSMDKVLQDCMQGTVYENDWQIWKIKHKEMRIDKKNPRVELTIWEEIR